MDGIAEETWRGERRTRLLVAAACAVAGPRDERSSCDDEIATGSGAPAFDSDPAGGERTARGIGSPLLDRVAAAGRAIGTLRAGARPGRLDGQVWDDNPAGSVRPREATNS